MEGGGIGATKHTCNLLLLQILVIDFQEGGGFKFPRNLELRTYQDL